LAKVVYFTRDPRNSGGGKLNFTKFETEHIDDCIGFLKRLVGGKGEGAARGRKMCVMATGGGSYKFYERMRKELDVEVIQEDEMECLIVGTSLSPRGASSRKLMVYRPRLLYSGNTLRGIYLFTYG